MLISAADKYATEHKNDQPILIANKTAGINRSGQDVHSNDNSRESGNQQGDMRERGPTNMIKWKKEMRIKNDSKIDPQK